MKKPLSFLFALLFTATTWAQVEIVDTDAKLRAAIANNGANITVTADIDLSNSTLSIAAGTTVTIDLGGHALDRKLKWRGDGGGQVITVRSGATLNISNGTLKGGWGGNAGGLSSGEPSAQCTALTSYLPPTSSPSTKARLTALVVRPQTSPSRAMPRYQTM